MRPTRIRDFKMLHTSNLTIGAAVANRCEAMEADTISKNGRSLKSQMSRRQFLCCFVIVVFAVLAAFTSCDSKDVFDGVYVTNDNREPLLTITFSGDKCKLEANGNLYAEGIFKVIEEQKKGLMRGTINFADRDWMYGLEGDNFWLEDRVFIKKKSTPVQQELVQKKSVQEKWEYMVIDCGRLENVNSLVRRLNALGSEGWELVSPATLNDGYSQFRPNNVLFLKRKL